MGRLEVASVNATDLLQWGVDPSEVPKLLSRIREAVQKSNGSSDEELWCSLTLRALRPEHPHTVHAALYSRAYSGRDEDRLGPAPVWLPTAEGVARSNAARLMRRIATSELAERDGRGSSAAPRVFGRGVDEGTRAAWLAGATGDPRTDWVLLQRMSCERVEDFWQCALADMGFAFDVAPAHVLRFDRHSDHPDGAAWFPDGRLNAARAALDRVLGIALDEGEREAGGGGDAQARPGRAALVVGREAGEGMQAASPVARTGVEVARAARRVCLALRAWGVVPGDVVAVAMPLNEAGVAALLGILLAGAVAACIPESFSAPEIRARLAVSKAVAMITVEEVARGGGSHPLFLRAKEAGAPRCAVVRAAGARGGAEPLRTGDVWFEEGLLAAIPPGSPELDDPSVGVSLPSNAPAMLLFSSGTTGEPKAIPLAHATLLRCATDARLLFDVGHRDRICWPTSLGWMMGAWVIFSAMLNGAQLCVFDGAPTGREFADFVAESGVTMLGTVPSLVAGWRAKRVLDGVDWSRVRRFPSTGEASSADDSLWLSGRVPGYAPVLEYCGGTELAGGYICGTMLQPQAPSHFSTPGVGYHIVLKEDDEDDEAGGGAPGGGGSPAPRLSSHLSDARPSKGEVLLGSPTLGSSQALLQGPEAHHRTYYEGVPRLLDGTWLRRHGDVLERLPAGFYRAGGRSDDALNLGGIKTSSLEIERAVLKARGPGDAPLIADVAAVGVPPETGGPDELHLFVVLAEALSSSPTLPSRDELRKIAQAAISSNLNPLFRVKHVEVRQSLPRNASNKLLRRQLRHEARAARPGAKL